MRKAQELLHLGCQRTNAIYTVNLITNVYVNEPEKYY